MDFVFPYLVQFLREYTGKASIPTPMWSSCVALNDAQDTKPLAVVVRSSLAPSAVGMLANTDAC